MWRQNRHRWVVSGLSATELAAKLDTAMSAAPTRPISGKPPRVAVIFTGQGSEYVGMAGGLYASSPTFRAAIGDYSAMLSAFPEWNMADLETLLFSKDAESKAELALALTKPSFTQPALVALALALYKVFTVDYAVVPTVVFCHSLNEISACCVAGLISVEHALHLALVRVRHEGLEP